MFKVVKRDGEVADFDLQKIGCAIEKAFDATQMQYNKDMVDLLNLRVTADFQRPAMQMWQRRTFCTVSREKKSAI